MARFSRFLYGAAAVAVVMIGLIAGGSAGPAVAAASADTMFAITNFDGRGPTRTLEHPRRFELRSAGLRVTFLGLRWRHWGQRSAIAEGRVRVCEPGSGCRTRHTVLTAGSRQRCAEEYFYDRVTASAVPILGAGPVELPVETIPCASPPGRTAMKIR